MSNTAIASPIQIGLPRHGVVSNASRERKFRWIKRFTNVVLAVHFLYLAIPREIVELVYPELKTPEYPLAALATVAVLFELLFTQARPGWFTVLLLFCCGDMALIGFSNGYPAIDAGRWYQIDCLEFCGYLAGLAWVSNRSDQQICEWFRWIACLLIPLQILSVLGLSMGFLTPLTPGKRLYSFALFDSNVLLLCLLPFLVRVGKRRGQRDRSLQLLLLALATVAAGGFISSARSIAIRVCVIAPPVLLLAARERLGKGAPRAAFMIALGIAAFGVILAVPEGTLSESYLVSRLETTDLSQESRWTELQSIREQIDGKLLTGLGFGSWYSVEKDISTDGRAFAPHIGLFTLVLKGGVFVFLIAMLPPLCVLLHRFVRWNRLDPCARRFTVGALGFFVTALTSGGWRFSHLFILGACYAALTRVASTHLPARVGIPKWRLQ
jgi:hypothetical protein